MNPLDEYGRPAIPPPTEGPKGLMIGLAAALAGVLISLLFVNQALHPDLFVYVILIVTTSLLLVIVLGFFGSAITHALA